MLNKILSSYVAWRKTIRRLWELPNTTHCSLLQSINDCIPIEIILEQRCAKFIWLSLNSTNTIIKTIALLAISSVIQLSVMIIGTSVLSIT